jgi:hypothetical protein
MKEYGGVEELHLHAFLASALGADESSASRPSLFTPEERIPSTHWIRGMYIQRYKIRGLFEKFVDWRQCAAVMQRQ